MFTNFFGVKENIPEESLRKLKSFALPGNGHKMRAIKTQKSEKKETKVASPESSLKNCSEENLDTLDPGLAKARSFKNKLDSALDLETLDPNNMKPLFTGNESLAVCKVCARSFVPERIDTHQSICQRMAQRDAQAGHKSKHLISKPATNMTRRAKAKQKLVVRPHSPKPSSSVHSQSHPAAPPSKNSPNVSRPRPLTAKPDLEDLTCKKVNCPQSNELASASNQKRPRSAFPFLLPKFVSKPKVEVDERIACPTCQRKFNKNTASRHIPWCAQQASLISQPKPPPRQKYVVPKLKKITTNPSATPQKIEKESNVPSTSPATLNNQEFKKSQRARSKAGPACTQSPTSHTRTPNKHQVPEVEFKPTRSRRCATQPKSSPETQSQIASSRFPLHVAELKPTVPGRCRTPATDLPQTQSRMVTIRRQLPVAESKPAGSGGSRTMGRPQTQSEKRYR